MFIILKEVVSCRVKKRILSTFLFLFVEERVDRIIILFKEDSYQGEVSYTFNMFMTRKNWGKRKK